MNEFYALYAMFGGISAAIIGHAAMTWYKLGRIEEKLDAVHSDHDRLWETVGRLQNGKQDKKQ